MNLSITIYVEVSDEAAFRREAHDRAIQDGLDEVEAACYLDEDEKSLGDCGIMLFDPGTAPAGASIIDSTAE
jgi:hypothetical protein